MRLRLAPWILCPVLAGCAADAPVPGDPLPAARLDRIVEGARTGDTSTADLVEELDASDAAVRMLAAEALRRREGTDLGFHHHDPSEQRDATIRAWVDRVNDPARDDSNGHE